MALEKCKKRMRCSLPADVLWGSFVTHSFLPHGQCKRTPKDVCGEAIQQQVTALDLLISFQLIILHICLS